MPTTTTPASLKPRSNHLQRGLRRLRNYLDALQPADVVVNRDFRRLNGFSLDLHHPKLFVEKIQWLKLHHHTPLQTQCADKIAVRDYVIDTIGSNFLIPVILTTYDVNDINPTKIPEKRFVAKTNHDYASVIICKDRENFDWAQARTYLKKKMSRNFYWRRREPVYRDIKPGIIVEKFLDGKDGADVEDLKFYCFHGRVEMIQVIAGRFSTQTITMYDREWRRLSVCRRGVPAAAEAQPRPERLDEMIALAERLAKPFIFARVDLYDSGGRTWFGEITFYPGSGLVVFDPLDYEHQLGALLRLPTAM